MRRGKAISLVIEKNLKAMKKPLKQGGIIVGNKKNGVADGVMELPLATLSKAMTFMPYHRSVVMAVLRKWMSVPLVVVSDSWCSKVPQPSTGDTSEENWKILQGFFWCTS